MRLRSSWPSMPITRLTPVMPSSDSMRESCEPHNEDRIENRLASAHNKASVTQGPSRTSMYSTVLETETAGGENILLRFTRRSTEMKLSIRSHAYVLIYMSNIKGQAFPSRTDRGAG